MFKKIILLFLASTIVFSCMVPVFAVEPESANDVIIGTLADGILTGLFPVAGGVIGSAYGQPAAGVFIGTVVGEGIKNLSDYYAAGYTDEDLYAQLDEYNSQLPFPGYTSTGALIMPIPIQAISNHTSGTDNGTHQWSGTFNGNTFSASGVMYGSENIVYVIPAVTSAPINGYYTYHCDFSGTNGAHLKSEIFPAKTRTHFMAGSDFVTSSHRLQVYGTSRQNSCVVNGSIYYLVEPDVAIGDDVYSVFTRPSTLTVPLAVRNPDNTYTTYNQNIVNETDNIFFNPVINDTIPFVNWSFDYATRTYTLTLEDGSVVTVIYGDDCISIIQGDHEYTVYYVIPSEEDPGADPDDPSTDDGSGWAWLQGAWTEMMDKLSGILEAITDLELSPEINVDVEINGEEQVTQESWFSDLLTKFGFVTSVHSIYSQLIADVTSDAATAVAVADGEVMLADVTSGHAAIDGRASYTAPELAISFGSSDKYGVDWAGIRPLDLSWYAPYKETVDGILSGILWLSYLFLLIKRAPGIIRGAEMVTEDRIKIDTWRMRH